MRTDEVVEVIEVEPVWAPATAPRTAPDEGAPRPTIHEEEPVAEPSPAATPAAGA